MKKGNHKSPGLIGKRSGARPGRISAGPAEFFRRVLAQQKVLVSDGAMGTLLLDKVAGGGCLEELNLRSPGIIADIHAQYVVAGADIIETNTFGGNRLKLKEFGLEPKLVEINQTAVKLARQAAARQPGRQILIAGSLGPSGQFIQPIGQYSFDEVYAALAEQARILAAAGVDLIIAETMADLAEIKAAALAVRQNTKLPVICQMTYGPLARTVTGTPALSQWLTLAALGVMGIGANCSDGPAELLPVIKIFSRAQRQGAGVRPGQNGIRPPLISVLPNAGRPALIKERPVYPLGPDKFAPYIKQFLAEGVQLIGSCCGSTPEHTRMIRREVDSWIKSGGQRSVPDAKKQFAPGSWLSSRLAVLAIPADSEVVVAGQRINPTARRSLAQALKDGHFQVLKKEAKDQVAQGARLIDVNVAAAGLNEKTLMAAAVSHLGATVSVPLILDSADPLALEAGLKNYPGKALINSVTGEAKSLKTILPLAARYGAAVIGLTLDEKGIPDGWAGRLAIAKKITAAAAKYNIPRTDIFIDPLVMTVASRPDEARETLKALAEIKKQLGTRTSLGVSNVSHGLPQRRLINRTYLVMAAAAGVDLVIADPADQEIFGLLKAVALLLGQDKQAKNYLDFISQTGAAGSSASGSAVAPKAKIDEAPADMLRRLVREGDRDEIVAAAQKALVAGLTAQQVIDAMVAGMEEVGRLYDKNQMFLPQVMASAAAMKEAFDSVKKFLPAADQKKDVTAIIATVQGDVHDIGKNIVAILLENSGFKVIDLGKNVPASAIAAAALKYKPNLICLSALLTTTMLEMKVVQEQLRKKGLDIPVLIGGAVITEEFASSIKAAYAPDALAAARTAARLSRGQT